VTTTEHIRGRLVELAARHHPHFPGALHESFHAIAAIYVGATFDYIAIGHDHGEFQIDQDVLDSLSPDAAALIAIAGPIAQALHCGWNRALLIATDKEQFERAIERAPAARRDAIRTSVKREGVDLVIEKRRDGEWLTRELLEPGKLAYEQCRQILKGN
jgi:hypothetical protein